MTTQQQIAEHLGLSQQAVSKQLSKLGIDWKTASLDQIRLEYIKQLRKAAAGQNGRIHEGKTGSGANRDRASAHPAQKRKRRARGYQGIDSRASHRFLRF